MLLLFRIRGQDDINVCQSYLVLGIDSYSQCRVSSYIHCFIGQGRSRTITGFADPIDYKRSISFIVDSIIHLYRIPLYDISAASYSRPFMSIWHEPDVSASGSVTTDSVEVSQVFVSIPDDDDTDMVTISFAKLCIKKVPAKEKQKKLHFTSIL